MAYPRDSYGAYPEGIPPSPRAPGGAPSLYQLTPEEYRVLRECNKESFYQRCVPLMALLGGATYYGIKIGYLKPSPTGFGVVPKVSLAVTAGFILGKLSYKTKCEEKILSLPPNSRLRESIVKRRLQERDIAGTLRDTLIMDPTFGPSVMPFGGGDVYSDVEPPPKSTFSDLDVDRPMDSFDDSFRINTGTQDAGLTTPPPSQSASVTYDELRRRNREEYDSKYRYKGGVSSFENTPPSSYLGPVPGSPPAFSPSQPTPSTAPQQQYDQQGSYYQQQRLQQQQQQSTQQRPQYKNEYGGVTNEGKPYQSEPTYYPPESSELQQRPPGTRKNQYGDVWER